MSSDHECPVCRKTIYNKVTGKQRETSTDISWNKRELAPAKPDIRITALIVLTALTDGKITLFQMGFWIITVSKQLCFNTTLIRSWFLINPLQTTPVERIPPPQLAFNLTMLKKFKKRSWLCLFIPICFNNRFFVGSHPHASTKIAWLWVILMKDRH